MAASIHHQPASTRENRTMMRLCWIRAVLGVHICIIGSQVTLVAALRNALSLDGTRVSLVTGANGFVGREIIHEIVTRFDGDHVLGLVRSHRVKMEREYWRQHTDRVEIVPYDMLDGGKTLRTALSKCHGYQDTCIYHVASVFGPSNDHKQVAQGNVKGTEDVVRELARFRASSKSRPRLVLTSSMAAVRATGQVPKNGKVYTFEDWNTMSELGSNWGASYQWSKAESERQAWKLAKDMGIPMTTLCPSFVFGPSHNYGASSSYSIDLVTKWMRGESEVQSRLCVDVRDVASTQVTAGTSADAIGKRYIVSAERRLASLDTANALKKASPVPEKVHADTKFDGGAIRIGEQEVEAIERLNTELGIVLRPVAQTFEDMGNELLAQNALTVRN